MREREPRQVRSPERRRLKNRFHHWFRRPSPTLSCADPGTRLPLGAQSPTQPSKECGEGGLQRASPAPFQALGAGTKAKAEVFREGKRERAAPSWGMAVAGWQLLRKGSPRPEPVGKWLSVQGPSSFLGARQRVTRPGPACCRDQARRQPPPAPAIPPAPCHRLHASAQAATPFPMFLHSTAIPASVARPPRTARAPARVGACKAGG